MGYFKVDESFYGHPKVMALPRRYRGRAVGLWATAGSWCVRHNMAGRVPAHMLPVFSAPPSAARSLVDVRLWDLTDDGWVFHNWRRWQVLDYRPRIADALREAVYDRDGYACLHCGTTERLTLDHIYPYVFGGEDTYENLQTLCAPCNSSKGARI